MSLRRRWAALLTDLPRTLPRRRRRRRVAVELRAWLPGWSLRGVCGGLAFASVVLAGAGPTLTVVGAALGLLLVLWPRGPLPVVVLGFVALVLATAGSGAPRPAAFAVLAGTHLLVALAAVLAPYGWSVRVELRALLAPARRYLPVQLAAQLVALVGALVTRGRVELAWAAPLAAVALAALVVWLVPRFDAPPAPAPPAGAELADGPVGPPGSSV